MSYTTQTSNIAYIAASDECPICFYDIGYDNLMCHKISCNTKLCGDCADAYLNVSLADNLIPTCPGCKSVYIQNNFKNLPRLRAKYNKTCFLQLIGNNGTEARKNYEIINKLEALRNERKVFLENKFPAAIALTAQVIMPGKLRKLDRKIIDKVKDHSNQSSRICMNLTCNGSLTSDFTCITCGTSFCKSCENMINPGHICKQSDVDSVKVVNQSVRCPKCQLPIIKSDGCDNMTCANCNTNFTYSDGKLGGNGGNDNLVLHLETKILLSKYYNKYLNDNNLLNLMHILEKLKPAKINEGPVNKILLRYYKNNMQEDVEEEARLAKNYEKYILAKYYNQLYQNLIIEIEQLIIKQQLDQSNMKDVINKLSNLNYI